LQEMPAQGGEGATPSRTSRGRWQSCDPSTLQHEHGNVEPVFGQRDGALPGDAGPGTASPRSSFLGSVPRSLLHEALLRTTPAMRSLSWTPASDLTEREDDQGLFSSPGASQGGTSSRMALAVTIEDLGGAMSDWRMNATGPDPSPCSPGSSVLRGGGASTPGMVPSPPRSPSICQRDGKLPGNDGNEEAEIDDGHRLWRCRVVPSAAATAGPGSRVTRDRGLWSPVWSREEGAASSPWGAWQGRVAAAAVWAWAKRPSAGGEQGVGGPQPGGQMKSRGSKPEVAIEGNGEQAAAYACCWRPCGEGAGSWVFGWLLGPLRGLCGQSSRPRSKAHSHSWSLPNGLSPLLAEESAAPWLSPPPSSRMPSRVWVAGSPSS